MTELTPLLVTLQDMITLLVSEAERVKLDVISSTTSRLSMITIEVAPQDLGKIIGRNGSVIKSLQTLASAYAGKVQKTVVLELVE